MLNINKAFTYLDNRFTLRKSTKNWWVFECPYCGKTKRAVNFKYNRIHCWTSSCKETIGKLSIVQFLMVYEGVTYYEAKRLIDMSPESSIESVYMEDIEVKRKSDVILPDGYKSLLEGTGTIGNRCRNYWKGRGFDLEELDELGVGYVGVDTWEWTKKNFTSDKGINFFGYSIIPFKRNGLLVYYKGRGFMGQPKEYKYQNPRKEWFGIGKGDLLFNEDSLDYLEEVYITEGEIDSMTLKDSVGIMGLDLSSTQKSRIIQSPSVKRVCIALDEGFEKYSYKIAAELIDFKEVKVVELKGGDPNDMGKESVDIIRDKTKVLDYETLYDKLLD